MSLPFLAPPPTYFASAFPFHLVLDRSLVICQGGAAIRRFAGELGGQPFFDHFSLLRQTAAPTFDRFAAAGPRFMVARHIRTKLAFRGELVPDAASGHLFLLVTPVIRSFAELERLGLQIEDFAGHDAIYDTLMLIEGQELAIADSRRLNDDLVRQRAALQSSEERLIALNLAKDEFLAIASHELRTPVAAILGAAEVMVSPRAGTLTAVQSRFHRIILEEVDRLQRLVNDMLDMAALQAGKLRHDRAHNDLQVVISQAERTLAKGFDDAGVKLAVKVSDAPLIAYADSERIRQVLINLLANALKFSPPGSQVSLRAWIDNGHFELAIADEGAGIPPEARRLIFEKFFQLDGGAERMQPGVGLGLSICRAIVEDGHGGRIWVEGREPAGSVFRVSLPPGPPA